MIRCNEVYLDDVFTKITRMHDNIVAIIVRFPRVHHFHVRFGRGQIASINVDASMWYASVLHVYSLEV